MDGDHAPRAGELFSNPYLADCLDAIATDGKRGFYHGRIADAVVAIVREHGGVLTHEVHFIFLSPPPNPQLFILLT